MQRGAGAGARHDRLGRPAGRSGTAEPPTARLLDAGCSRICMVAERGWCPGLGVGTGVGVGFGGLGTRCIALLVSRGGRNCELGAGRVCRGGFATTWVRLGFYCAVCCLRVTRYGRYGCRWDPRGHATVMQSNRRLSETGMPGVRHREW
eukprot:358937-Chlamydomonas_euryale.AAC.3